MKTIRAASPNSDSKYLNRFTKLPGLILPCVILVAALTLVRNAGAATYTWNVISGNWSTPASWSPTTAGPSGPLAGDSVIFGTVADASTVSNSPNSTVDAGFAGTVANLTYDSVSLAPFVYDVTQIPAGKTLTVANDLLVGGLNEGAGPYLTYGIMTGGGTLVVTATNLAVENYGSAAGANTYANFDLSGLASFVYNNSNGVIGVADTTLPQTSGSKNVRAGGNFILAGGSNFITVSNLNLATCTAPQAGPTSSFVLGAGTNVINVGTFNVANNKNPGNVLFTTPTGGLKIRGVAGGSTRGNVIIGNRSVGGGTGTTPGQMLLNGHPVDILANTLTVGEVSVTAGPSGTAGQFGNGTLQFDTGTIDANSLVMALNTAPNAAGGLCGTLSAVTVGANATLRVGSGGITLLSQSASNICSSTLTISNGTVICNGNITVVTNAANGTGSTGETNVINLVAGGNLVLGPGAVAGTASSPIGQLALDTNSVIRFAAPLTTQTNIVVNNLVWPATDSALTFVVSNLSATTAVGTTIPLIQFGTLLNGAFTSPSVVLPSGVTGTLSLSGNTILLTITGSIYPSLSVITPGLTTLSTNQYLTCTASSSVSTITNVQVVVTSTTLGGLATSTITNSLGFPALSVTGLGTSTANIRYTLAANTIYPSVTVKVTDANGVSAFLSASTFDTLQPALVIEASDFNYSSGQFMDTPANGGFALYAGTVGTEGIDEHKAARSAPKSYYRPGDAVIVQNANPGLGAPPSATEQKFVTAAVNGDTVNVEQEIGFNTPGDWLNYTRTFGSSGSALSGTYNVWCYLATSGSGAQASFSQVTSDPTQSGQTTNFLGTFGNAAFTDNGYNNFVYVPLLDQYGNRAAITITNGQQTFKSTVVGNPNLAFYILMPVAPVLTPQLLQVYPDGTAPYQSTNHLTFTLSPAQGAAISTNNIQLILNGVNVSSGLVFSQSGGVWTATFTIQSNAIYTAVINATNNAGLSTSYAFNFDTFNANNYQWEAVDYDFSTNNGTGDGGTAGGGWSGGLFIDNPVPSGDTNAIPNNGSLQVNSYWNWPTAWSVASDGYGAIAQQGVDINWPTNSTQGLGEANAAYRFPDLVGSQIATDYVRQKFLVAQTNLNDPAVCQYNIGYFYAGDWLNYTRTFPTNTFNVWARMAAGGGAFTNATLSAVTSGVGTSNQTTAVLGTFTDANPAGWQTYHTIPLLDVNGNKAVVQLSGKTTLRLTAPTNASSASGAVNVLYFMLTPAVAPAQPYSISARLVGGQLQISVPTQVGYNYAVWSASNLSSGGWIPVGTSFPGDGTVHVITPAAAASQGFYRVVAQ